MSVYQRDSRYLVYWHENGKRHDKSFGRGEQARVLAEQFDQALKTAKEKNCPLPDADLFLASSSSGADSGVLSAPAPSGMPSGAVTAMPQGICLLELGEKYLTHMQASGRTAKHIHNVANLIRNHFVPILGNKPVEAITYQDDIIPFIIHYQGTSATTGKARSQYTVNKYCDYLSFIFNFGIANNLCQHNPLKNWKKPKVQQWDLQLTLEDAKKIMYKGMLSKTVFSNHSSRSARNSSSRRGKRASSRPLTTRCSIKDQTVAAITYSREGI